MWKIEYKLIASTLQPEPWQIIDAVLQNDGVFLFDNRSESNCGWQCAGFNPVIKIGESKTVFGEEVINVEPLTLIDNLRQQNRQCSTLPLLTGYLAYDYKDKLEEAGLFQGLSDTRLPLLDFRVYEYYLVKNQDGENWLLYQLVFPFVYQSCLPPDFDSDRVMNGNIKEAGECFTNFNRAEFMGGVEKIQEYIRAGDIYQANLTREIKGVTTKSAHELAVKLYHSNQIAYGVIAKIDSQTLISTSPELFFAIDGDLIKTSPIKGTVSRSLNKNEDKANLQQLLNSPKERAELAMIVDLLRNDLGKICCYDSVRVTDFPLVQTLQNVYHLYADISGELNTHSFATIMRALFPGGSITGCPKIRACQIIEEIEKQGRGAYTGSFGRLNLDGGMQFNILIRTLFYNQNGDYSYNVGGGITLKSDPAAEFAETEHKGRTIASVLHS